VSDAANGAREAIVTRIIEWARRGECDPHRLRDRVITEAGTANGNASGSQG
jgi:tartrate dehydratase beta subunit/fumarate hydratase class I family protein